MKKYFLMAIALLAMACNNNQPSTSNEDADTQDSIATKAAPSAEETPSARASYTFQTSFQKDEEGQVNAVVLTCQSGEKTQRFVCELLWSKDEDLMGGMEVEEQDFNFDGFPDVLVCLGDFGVNPSNFPMLSYAGFVWNNETQSFDRVAELEDIVNVEIDADNKTIVSNYSTVVGDTYHEVYAWKNGKLDQIESTSDSYPSEEEEEE